MNESQLEPLSDEDCLRYLREATVGRIAFVIDGDPVVFPVNYRLVESSPRPLLAMRTRPGNVIEQAPTSVAFEIDSIDHLRHQGWSVLVRGELLRATATSEKLLERYDPDSWLADREALLFIEPWSITGRKLHSADPLWPFRPGEYL